MITRETALLTCYRCQSQKLTLAPLTPWERGEYVKQGLVVRVCMNCGLEQNHMNDGETMSPKEAASTAASKAIGG